MTARKRYVLLDRDGTILVERNYLASPGEVELLPNAALGLRRFHELGFGSLILTNQSGVGRGYFDMAAVESVHRRMHELLALEGASIDGIYICPHAPEEACECRKPKPALALRAAADRHFEPSECLVIGDKACDIELGRALGARTILVRTGYGEEELRRGAPPADFVADDLGHAAELVSNIMDHPLDTHALWSGARQNLREHIEGSIAAKRRVLAECEDAILDAAAAMAAALSGGGKVLLCGNGGSAADCQHIAAELVSVLTQTFPRPGLAAIALTTDSSLLTASANDFGFEGIFERQVQALGRPGDTLIAISTSGNSENVLRAVAWAAAHGMKTVAMTGAPGGRLAREAGIAIKIPSDSTQFIQESHIMVGHILCAIVERTLFA